MPTQKIYISLFLIFLGSNMLLGQYNVDVKAALLINNETEYIVVKAKASNLLDITFSGRYVLTTIVGDIVNRPSTVSKNSQKGTLILTANESKIVCNSKISVGENQKAVALLLIYNEDGKLIGKDRWVVNDPDDTAPITIEKIDIVKEREGVSIRGIVTDRTKTKPGKDYFKEFYSLYLYNEIQTEEVVNVEEQFAQGRNTRIQVKVGNTIVATFISRPSYDFMKKMAKSTIDNIKRYLLRQENTRRQIQG